jgi:regulatory protein SWI6
VRVGGVLEFGADGELQENMMDLLVDTPIMEPDAERKKSDILAGESAPSFPLCLVPTFHILEMSKMIQELSVQMANSKRAQDTRYTETKLKLVAATRQLTEHRKSMEEWEAKSEELDQVNLHIRNLEQSASYPDIFDWTGRTNDLNAPSLAFVRRGPGSLLKDDLPYPHRQSQANPVEGGTINPALTLGNNEAAEEEPIQTLRALLAAPLPKDPGIQTLIRLKRMKMWHTRIEMLMQQQLKVLKNASTEREMQYRKVVAAYAGIPNDKVDEVRRRAVF